ncbi:sodium bicarbonate cotransporter 3 isoform X6 [Episyrphus balteatus]|uniref:sodium bicarbonate cotransporter 3 isoform X6 n=1 Tax=Episyrphus balteatus TaxID=286459 RepID=UPI00248652B1|nr:sodium bicarbonate cotransporter 3 isoform X6 [Episyrphus balteatus]
MEPWTMQATNTDDEAPKDPRICQPDFQLEFSEKDFQGHRAHSVFVGVHVPGGGRRHSHRRQKRHHKENGEKLPDTEADRPITPPAQRVQFILGEDVDDGTHESHPLFSEMEELVKEGDEIEWKETARWIKFEEDVEEGGNRWSKPHVATLSLHSLFELRSLIMNGTIILDMEASNLETIAELVCENMVNAGTLPPQSREKVKDALLRRHRHQHETKNKSKMPIIRSLAEIGKNHSSSKKKIYMKKYKLDLQQAKTASPHTLHPTASSSGLNAGRLSPGPQTYGPNRDQRGCYLAVPSDDMIKSPSSQSMTRNISSNELSDHRGNTHFMRKIPPGAEASNILVGEVDFLEKILSGFIRLHSAAVMGDLTEVPVPTRFLFILLGPPGSNSNFHEIGRAMATLMSDEIFHEVAYRARKRDHLLAGIDEFLDAVTVLPPGEWDPTIRIEPPAAIPSQEVRKRPPEAHKEEVDEEEEEQRLREESGLSRTGRLFGGLINDFKRKAPWYWSDFTDALSLQCVASWIFLYFACLSPIITFGGLLGEATGKNMAAMESLVSGFVCGMGYGFFSGQPLTILGSTGPVLVFETIVYDFCQNQGWDYMTFRFWIGTWITLILLILVAIDASALVCYITRFTEENFATLIAFIFIYKAVENVLAIGKKFPIHPTVPYDCVCTPPLGSNSTILEWAKYDKGQCLVRSGTLLGMDCDQTETANVFLMSVILFCGTFVVSVILKDFKNALFFPSNVRQFISDFSVIIAIFSMSFLDGFMNIPTPKLEVPHEFKPTLHERGWVIPLFTAKNPLWSPIIAVFPAMLGTILIFMDQQITAVIINRKENKLKKGCGYHLDLFILAILIQICSLMGLPWFVAATVLSINHVNSLKKESECAAPGEKPQFLGVREQRVTHILIFLMIGGSVLLTPLLSHIPMPVLFGVFLYMGVASLKGLQFFDRILIMLMPVKYQPDYMFLRQVPIKRVHIFTLIQLACLIVLWLIKSFHQTSILFPLMLVVMIGIRKSLDLLFTRRELKILDDIMPEMTKRAAVDDDLHQLEDGTAEVPINITDDVNRTTIWNQVNKDTNKLSYGDNGENQLIIPVTLKVRKINGNNYHSNDNKLKGRNSSSPPNSHHHQRLSTMNEEEETNTKSSCNDLNIVKCMKVEAKGSISVQEQDTKNQIKSKSSENTQL